MPASERIVSKRRRLELRMHAHLKGSRCFSLMEPTAKAIFRRLVKAAPTKALIKANLWAFCMASMFEDHLRNGFNQESAAMLARARESIGLPAQIGGVVVRAESGGAVSGPVQSP